MSGYHEAENTSSQGGTKEGFLSRLRDGLYDFIYTEGDIALKIAETIVRAKKNNQKRGAKRS